MTAGVKASAKPAEWRRWLGIALRSAHLVAVVLMGAAVLGSTAPAAQAGAWLVLATGLGLLASELLDRRVSLAELAGALVLAKLAVAGWMAWDGARSAWLFWPLMVVSAVSAHAPKWLRHWRPARA